MVDAAGAGKAALYVVATPIGNLKDVTLRALEVLKSVEIIAAEDTRVTAKLLNHHGIASRKLIALHQHNEQHAAPEVIAHLAAGRSVALTSDAGTPAFSDPGARLVSLVRDAGYAVVPVPGANAAAAALSVSGLPGPQFFFYGFLPVRSGERRRAIEALMRCGHALVFYEAPHRVREAIADLGAILGVSRRIVIARELTKMFESIHVCSLGEAGQWLSADPHREKGEVVLIVEGAAQSAARESADTQRVLEILLGSLSVKQAAALASRITGASKNELYARALELKRAQER